MFCVVRDLSLDALLLGFNKVKGISNRLSYIYCHLELSFLSDLTLLVWNCGGLNAPHKRASTLGLLKKKEKHRHSIITGDTFTTG